MTGAIRWLTNLLYGVRSRVRKFEAAHPGESVVVAGACKAVQVPRNAPIERGAHWVTSRRAVLRHRRGDARVPFIP